MSTENATTAAADPETDTIDDQTAYNDLKRLTPSLAAELDHLRASLREHNLWLQRYGGQGSLGGQADDEALATVPAGLPTLTTGPPAGGPSDAPSPVPPSASPAPTAPARTLSPPPAFSAQPPSSSPSTSQPPPPTDTPTSPTATSPDIPSYASIVDNTLPPYGPSEVPGYSSAVRDDVMQRRGQLVEWLREGEELLREYSAQLAQLATRLNLPAEDADTLGTWNEAAPDNALPSYTMIEGREELMVGGVGEVPPTYARGSAIGAGAGVTRGDSSRS